MQSNAKKQNILLPKRMEIDHENGNPPIKKESWNIYYSKLLQLIFTFFFLICSIWKLKKYLKNKQTHESFPISSSSCSLLQEM